MEMAMMVLASETKENMVAGSMVEMEAVEAIMEDKVLMMQQLLSLSPSKISLSAFWLMWEADPWKDADSLVLK